ncbi:MAG: hypothetical protein RQ743_12640 [Bacteroidales bacterium]|nr:hypothetical protein [Bacteroidales bacterium]
MDLLKWYKAKVESSDLDPPLNNWDKIQDQLDIDNSWQAIDSYLDRRDRFVARLRISAAAGLLALTLAGAGWIYFSMTEKDEFQELTAEEIVPAESPETKTMEAEGTTGPVKDVPGKLIVDEAPLIQENLLNTTTLLASAEHNLNTEALSDTGFIDYRTGRQSLVIKKNGIGHPSISTTHGKDNYNNIDPVSIYPVETERMSKAFSKFYVGTTGQLANTWLVNQKTISGFKSASLVSTNATFGSNFGFYAGTNLLNRLDLQADLNLLAQNNQDYNEYLNGHYVSSKLKLDYSQLALSLRYYIMSDRFMHGEHGVNFGGYLAYLHNAYQKVDGETFYISDTYNKIDYGLVLAYEYIFPLYGQLGLGTGFRAYYGLNNIYSGDEYIPAYMNVTNNASVNITLSLKYLLK